MRKQTLGMIVVSMLAFLLISVSGAFSADAVGTRGASLNDVVTLENTFTTWTVQSLYDLEQRADGEIVVIVELDEVEYTLNVKPYSMRSENFKLRIQVESGELVEVEPPPPATYRGEVIGVPGSAVAASFYNGRLSAAVKLNKDKIWFIEPLSKYDEFAKTMEYVVYRSTDTFPTDYICGSGLIEQPFRDAFDLQGFGSLESGRSGDVEFSPQADELTDIAFDADYEFFQANLSNLGNTVSDIEDVLNGVEVVYQRDVGICYNITHIIVRTSSNDPYSGNDPSSLLSQFRNHWNSQQGSIQRDVAHLMTGHSLTGGVIGIAYLNGICNTWAYGVSKSRYTFSMNNRITLTAHELGHNWSAIHCNGDSDCHIMCSWLGGCAGTGLPNFGSRSISDISSYKSSRTCLDPGCGTVLDLIEPDPGEVGQTNAISVRGATPGEVVDFYFGFASGSTEATGCTGVFLSISNARRYAQVTANNDGIATLTMTVPNGASGRTVYLQAVDSSNCELSDIEVYTFP